MRKKFLVKPALQLKHLLLTLVVVLVAFVFCYLLFETQVSRAVASGILDEFSWIQLRSGLRMGFGVTLFLLLAGIGIENYFFFHTIAGPLYSLEKGIKRLASGDFSNMTRIRESDQLGEVIQAFEEMKKQIQLRIESHEKTAQVLVKELDQLLANSTSENVGNLRNRLKDIRILLEKKPS
ncbi:MAG: hypothetical protein KCHDKBKB_02188 [Elusimicrobia bacterium]|nr:hypothetical protein [Elusimicrobiota bacterium]